MECFSHCVILLLFVGCYTQEETPANQICMQVKMKIQSLRVYPPLILKRPYLHYTTPYKLDLGLKRELSLRAFQ